MKNVSVIKELREAQGLSQVELGAKAHINPQLISNWESGRNRPNSQSISKLSYGLGVSRNYLVDKIYGYA